MTNATTKRHIAAALCGVAFLAGCDRDLDLDVEVIEMDREHLVVEVKTKPGATVSLLTGRATADEDGVAKFDLPMAELAKDSDKNQLRVRAFAHTKFLVVAFSGSTEFDLPMPAVVAADLPAGDEPYLRFVGADTITDKSGTACINVQGKQFVPKVTRMGAGVTATRDDDGGDWQVSLPFRAQPGTTASIGSHKLDFGRSGAAAIETGLLDFVAQWPAASFGDRGAEHTLPVTFATGGHSDGGSMKFKVARWCQGRLAAELRAAVKDQEHPFKTAPRDDSVVLTSRANDTVFGLGHGATNQARWIAIEEKTSEKRQNGGCGYTTKEGGYFSVDTVKIGTKVTVYDTRDWSSVGSGDFEAGSTRCSEYGLSGSSERVYPSEGAIRTWLLEVTGSKA